MFDAALPHISVPNQDGPPLHRNIRASYPKNAHKIVAELNTLFADGQSKWKLDPSCDAISRFFVLPSRETVTEVVSEVLREAEKLNHHPSITVSEGAGNAPWLVWVTCATHQPAGLSVKDPRLAKKVEDVARGHGVESYDEEIPGSVLADLERWHWQENIGRAQPSLDVAEEDSSEDMGSNEQARGKYWRLNTAEDVEVFLKREEKVCSNDVPTLRGLVL